MLRGEKGRGHAAGIGGLRGQALFPVVDAHEEMIIPHVLGVVAAFDQLFQLPGGLESFVLLVIAKTGQTQDEEDLLLQVGVGLGLGDGQGALGVLEGLTGTAGQEFQAGPIPKEVELFDLEAGGSSES